MKDQVQPPIALIRKWRRQGKAMPAGMLPAPVPGGLQPLYYLTELENLAEKHHQRRQLRAGPSPG